ncbi:MAG: hypothetical protein LAT83_04875 [Kiritimatiellae bacterium]|nr:hypothetical protein [Kiritimatiellia bacterium]
MALNGTTDATIVMSLRVRKDIEAVYGRSATPGYAVQVHGHTDCSPRNLIVLRMRKEDPLLGKNHVVRIGGLARKRLGIQPGDKVQIIPFKWETYYHGTRAPDPMVIAKNGWIVGPGNVYGSGVYLTQNMNTARSYGSSGSIITAEVAWGNQIVWPLQDGTMKQELTKWCKEHKRNAEQLLALPGVTPNYESDPRHKHVLRWARLYGHYYNGGPTVRVFPGPVRSGYKPNRLRVVSVAKPDGTVLWQRSRLPR